MGRDHAWECDACGIPHGGLNDLVCGCEGCICRDEDVRAEVAETFSGLREPVGDYPPDSAIAEIVAELERRDG